MITTGYTQKFLEDGQTLKEFAFTCARAFGHCTSLRDAPLDSALPQAIDIDPYYENRYKDAVKALLDFNRLSTKEKIQWAKKQKKQEIDEYKQCIQNNLQNVDKINAMLKKINAWTPPTKDHEELARFMISQLMTVKPTDVTWEEEHIETLSKMSPTQFYKNKLKELKNEVNLALSSLNDERQQIEKSNAWLKKLHESFNK